MSATSTVSQAFDRRAFIAIGLVSVVALGFLMWLLYLRPEGAEAPPWTAHLPSLNAFLNASSAICLLFGYFAIRRGQQRQHKRWMLGAVSVASVFLVSYIVYHHFHGDTAFTGQGLVRPVYFFILISHIVLSMVGFPLVLTTLFFAGTQRFARHRALARYTFPIWLYVSVSGVAVYFFLKYLG